MRKILFFALIFLISLTVIFSPEVKAADDGSRNVIIPSDQIISSDYFAAGNSVTLSGQVDGDAFLAGGNVLFDGTVNGDLLVAGGNVIFNGKTGENGNLFR